MFYFSLVFERRRLRLNLNGLDPNFNQLTVKHNKRVFIFFWQKKICFKKKLHIFNSVHLISFCRSSSHRTDTRTIWNHSKYKRDKFVVVAAGIVHFVFSVVLFFVYKSKRELRYCEGWKGWRGRVENEKISPYRSILARWMSLNFVKSKQLTCYTLFLCEFNVYLSVRRFWVKWKWCGWWLLAWWTPIRTWKREKRKILMNTNEIFLFENFGFFLRLVSFSFCLIFY